MTTPQPRILIDEVCSACNGSGKLPPEMLSIAETDDCPTCGGAGYITHSITLERLTVLILQCVANARRQNGMNGAARFF